MKKIEKKNINKAKSLSTNIPTTESTALSAKGILSADYKTVNFRNYGNINYMNYITKNQGLCRTTDYRKDRTINSRNYRTT